MVHHRAADVSDWPRLQCPMRDFPHAVWGPPPCAAADPTWVTCQDETWRALSDAGLRAIRAAGVSNWRVPNLRRMERLGQDLPEVNQVEAHIGWHDDELFECCPTVGAATPLGRGMPTLVQPGADRTMQAVSDRAFQRENLGALHIDLLANETEAGPGIGSNL
eukprot:gene21365-10274_t